MPQPRIVIFDGVCNFCNGAVNFIIHRDPLEKFRFTPMQSRAGQSLLQAHGIQDLCDDTFVLIEGESVKLRTDAALAIAAELNWPWPVFAVLRYLPKEFRDYFYRAFARRRYCLFGKLDVCMEPTLTMRRRFLDDT